MAIPSTIEYPYAFDLATYETDNIKITSTHMKDTSNSPSGMVYSLMYKTTGAGVKFGYPGNVTITHEFKNGIKVNPTKLYFYATLSQSHYSISVTTYVWDDETQTQVQIASKQYSSTACRGAELDLSTEIMTSKIITVVSCRDTSLYYLIYDFGIDTTSKMVKNKVTTAIMQNELWIKHTSGASIDDGIEVAIVSDEDEMPQHIYEPELNAEAALLDKEGEET